MLDKTGGRCEAWDMRRIRTPGVDPIAEDILTFYGDAEKAELSVRSRGFLDLRFPHGWGEHSRVCGTEVIYRAVVPS